MTIAMTLLFSTLQCILKGYCYFVYLDTLIVCFRIHILQNGTNIYCFFYRSYQFHHGRNHNK